jgi:hypothetical protein
MCAVGNVVSADVGNVVHADVAPAPWARAFSIAPEPAAVGGSVRKGCLYVLGRESCRRAFCAPCRGRAADGDVLDAVDVRVVGELL